MSFVRVSLMEICRMWLIISFASTLGTRPFQPFSCHAELTFSSLFSFKDIFIIVLWPSREALNWAAALVRAETREILSALTTYALDKSSVCVSVKCVTKVYLKRCDVSTQFFLTNSSAVLNANVTLFAIPARELFTHLTNLQDTRSP